MNQRRIQPSAARQRFSQSGWNAKTSVLMMIGSQMLCRRLLRHIRAQRLRQSGAWVADMYRRSPMPRPNAARIIEYAEMAKRLNVWNPECVAESIVLWTCLRAGDYPATLRIGCRNVLGLVEAHMWVELHGEPLLDIEGDATSWQAFDRPWRDA